MPAEATEKTLKLIVNSADKLGLLTDKDGAKHVDLKATPDDQRTRSPPKRMSMRKAPSRTDRRKRSLLSRMRALLRSFHRRKRSSRTVGCSSATAATTRSSSS